jgi:ferric-dicitrate binding protein FerR (iron transport regulator)
MKRKEIIEKWLLDDLNDEDRKQSGDEHTFSIINQMEETLERLKSPQFNVDNEYLNLKESLKIHEEKKTRNLYPVYGLLAAAMIALILTFYFIFFSSDITRVETFTGQRLVHYLPDSSVVILNSATSISYEHKDWKNKRTIDMKGEAFYQVRKGSSFTVNGDLGQVEVLGTKFNVLNRNNVFEVKCFEGLVRVLAGENKDSLSAGNIIRMINDEYKTDNFVSSKESPGWTEGNYEYKSMPVSFILEEIERHFGVEIVEENVSDEKLFTGIIDQSDLKAALTTISLSMGCDFKITNPKTVNIRCE